MSSQAILVDRSVEQLLSSVRRRIRLHLALRGVAEWFVFTVAAVLCATLPDWLIGLPGWLRACGLVAILLFSGFQAWRRIFQPLLQPLPDDEVGAAIDLAVPDLREGLETLVSLQKAAETGDIHADVFLSRLQRQVSTSLPGVESADVVNRTATLHRSGLVAGVLLFGLLVALLWPGGVKLMLSRLAIPFANWESATDLHFEVTPGDAAAARGRDVTIKAIPLRHSGLAADPPGDSILEIRGESGDQQSINMLFDVQAGELSAVIPEVSATLSYRVVGGGASSRWYHLTVADAPRLEAAELTADPPQYTGLQPLRFPGAVGEMPVFEGSQIRLLATFSKPVTAAELHWIHLDQRSPEGISTDDSAFPSTSEQPRNSPDPVNPEATEGLPAAHSGELNNPRVVKGELAPDRQSAVFEFTAQFGGRFECRVRDELGLENPSEPDRRLLLLTDQPPELQVTGLRTTQAMRADGIVPLDSLAVDDLGLGRVELHYQRNEDAVRILPSEELQSGATESRDSFRVSLADLQVQDGDRVRFRVRAADLRPQPGPNVVWSDVWDVRIDPDAAAYGRDGLTEEMLEHVTELEKIHQQLVLDAAEVDAVRNRVHRVWNSDTRDNVLRQADKQELQGRALTGVARDLNDHPLMKRQAEELEELGRGLAVDSSSDLQQAAAADESTLAEAPLTDAARDLARTREQVKQLIEEIQKLATLEQELTELNRLAMKAEKLAEEMAEVEQNRSEAGAGNAPESAPQTPDRQTETASPDGSADGGEGKPANDSGDSSSRESKDGNRDAHQPGAVASDNDTGSDPADAETGQSTVASSKEQDLAERRDELNAEIAALLNREQELLNSARNAQQERMDALSRQAASLGGRQNQLANGVGQESGEVARDAHAAANRMQEAINNLRKADQQAGQASQAAEDIPDTSALEQAQQALRRGNLDTAQQIVEDTIPNAEAAVETLKAQAAGGGNADWQQAAQRAQQAAERATEALRDTAEELANLRDSRSLATDVGDTSSLDSASNQQPPASDGPAASLRRRLDDFRDRAAAISEANEADREADQGVRRRSQNLEKRLQDAGNAADAGQFRLAADRLRQASGEAEQMAQMLELDDQAVRQQRSADMAAELAAVADQAQIMQNDAAARSDSQRVAQRRISEEASELPEDFRDLAERLSLPELGMQQQARQAAEASNASANGRESGAQASEQLDRGQFADAADSGRMAAGEFSRAATMTGNGPVEESLVPSEVGDKVTDALQSLKQAGVGEQSGSPTIPGESESGDSEASSDSSSGLSESGEAGEGTPGEGGEASSEASEASGQSQGDQSAGESGSPGDGGESGPSSEGGVESGENGPPGAAGAKGGISQPGAGQGSGKLSEAADALRQAAARALPRNALPGKVSDSGGDGSQQPMGAASEWDERDPAARPNGGADDDWGGLNDELDTSSGVGAGVRFDSEYSRLIRLYTRGLNRVRAGEKPRK